MKSDIIVRLERLLARLTGEDRQAVIDAIEALTDATGTAKTPQRAIYEALFAAGVHVETEVILPSRASRSRSGKFRADIAVSRDGRIVALCECKAWARELSGRQREHYETSGYPYMVAGRDNIIEAIEWLLAKGRGE